MADNRNRMRPRARLITRAQLRADGMPERTIDRRVAEGRLFRVHHGVYAIGRPDLTPKDIRHAAVLALGPTAILSHTSAAQVWGLCGGALEPVHVTLPGSGRAQRRHIRVHRTTTLRPEDTLTYDSFLITSVDRTLVDLAAILPRPRLARAVEQAERLQRLDVGGLARAMAHNPPGVAKLRALLQAYTTAPETESELERRFLDFVDAHQLPRPELQAPIEAFRVDVYWPAWRLVVELDSIEFHLTRRGFQADRVRDAVLQRLNLRVLRLTSDRLRHDSAGILADILAFARTA
jgi:very-short-patch-repair endonuclease